MRSHKSGFQNGPVHDPDTLYMLFFRREYFVSKLLGGGGGGGEGLLPK